MNDQAIERFVDTGENIDLVFIWETIQGEGPFAGRPAIFVRLAGCNLQCSLCDTDYTKGRILEGIDECVSSIAYYRHKLVVITGGEPFRQSGLIKLVDALLDCYEVQIETNGTLYLPIDDGAYIVCSPKTSEIDKRLKPNAMKYVIRNGEVDGSDGLPFRSLGYDCRPARYFDCPVYVQPLDEYDTIKNKLNTEAAIDSCMKFGYYLSLQKHKIVGLE